MSLISLSRKSQPDNWRFKKSKTATSTVARYPRVPEIMGQVVPTVIYLMMDDYQRVWGEACYPVVD